jgi:hypothetical protein
MSRADHFDKPDLAINNAIIRRIRPHPAPVTVSKTTLAQPGGRGRNSGYEGLATLIKKRSQHMDPPVSAHFRLPALTRPKSQQPRSARTSDQT